MSDNQHPGSPRHLSPQPSVPQHFQLPEQVHPGTQTSRSRGHQYQYPASAPSALEQPGAYGAHAFINHQQPGMGPLDSQGQQYQSTQQHGPPSMMVQGGPGGNHAHQQGQHQQQRQHRNHHYHGQQQQGHGTGANPSNARGRRHQRQGGQQPVPFDDGFLRMPTVPKMGDQIFLIPLAGASSNVYYNQMTAQPIDHLPSAQKFFAPQPLFARVVVPPSTNMSKPFALTVPCNMLAKQTVPVPHLATAAKLSAPGPQGNGRGQGQGPGHH